eukprot:2507018-Prymnesium_polylepis.3
MYVTAFAFRTRHIHNGDYNVLCCISWLLMSDVSGPAVCLSLWSVSVQSGLQKTENCCAAD